MSLGLLFLLLGATLTSGGIVLYHDSAAPALRSGAAAAVGAGTIMFLIGLVNALSGTL
jgi:hypothetical protein